MVISNKIKAIIAFAAIAVSVEIITQLPASNFMESQTQVQNQETVYPSQQHALPPMPLTKLWGPQVASFDQAKSITGLPTASLPSYVPSGLKIGTIRASGSLIGVDFVPKNVTTQEGDTIQKVIDNDGGIMVIYSQEPIL